MVACWLCRFVECAVSVWGIHWIVDPVHVLKIHFNGHCYYVTDLLKTAFKLRMVLCSL